MVGSSIARAADGGVYLHAGPEIGVASTKAFTSQVLVLTLLALYFGRLRHLSPVQGERMIEELRALPAAVQQVLACHDQVRRLAARYAGMRNFLYLGRQYLYPVALREHSSSRRSAISMRKAIPPPARHARPPGAESGAPKFLRSFGPGVCNNSAPTPAKSSGSWMLPASNSIGWADTLLTSACSRASSRLASKTYSQCGRDARNCVNLYGTRSPMA